MDLSKNNDAEAVITIDDDDDSDDDDDDDSDDEENVNYGNLEFSVSEDKVENVNSLKEKLLSLYGVTINEDIKAKETDDKNAMRQWFNIVGPLENCRQAKAFILASCDPGQAAIFEFDPTLHKILSCESQKMRIEKESKTLLLFDTREEGTVVIQGADEISVGVAMSLLEAAAYEASVAMMSPNKDHQALFGKGDELIAMGSKRQTEPYVILDDQMEVDINDLEHATGEVALDVMKSLDPEIQRLVKCGREKNYTDEEIREVLEKSSKIPTASAFFRALHTYRNLKTVSSESSVHQSNKSDVVMPYLLTQSSDGDFKLDLTSLQRNNAQEARNRPTSVTDKNGILDRELCDDIHIQRVIQTVENRAKNFPDIKTPNRIRYPGNQGMFGDSVQSVKPVMDLMSISDAEERKRQAEANQQLNRKLFVEQSSASASPNKPYSYDRVTNLDEFSLPIDVIASDSSVDVNSGSPSGRKRHKKKKKKKVDLTAEENDYRSRSPYKPSDQDATTLRSQHGLQTKQPNTVTATITTAGHSQPIKVLDYFHKKPGVVTKQIENAPTSKQIPANLAMPNPPAMLPPFALAPSRPSVSSHLRYVVIDGSNIAMAHGNGKFFSCRGIEIAVQHFRGRGHKEITVFVPQWRRQMPRFEDQNPIRDQDILEKLKEQGIMNFTPSRRIPGKKNIVCYDDRFILRLAQDTSGIVVSNDNYRDLYMEKPEWAEIIETRVLSYTFVGDRFMLPDDPLGRGGPNLDELLSVTSKSIQSSTHNNSLFQLHPQAPNTRPQFQQFQRNPQFFAQQTPNSCVPIMPTGQWQTVQRQTRPGYPNARQWNRPTHTQDIGQWTNKINHAGIPVQAGRFPFRTSSAPFASHIRESSKFIVERAPSSQSLAAAGSFLDQTARHQTTSQPQHAKVNPSLQPRSEVETKEIKNRLVEMFPGQEEQIKELLLKNKMGDLTSLIDVLLEEI